MNMLELMAAPFAECLVLVAIHTYLGIHVLKRRVIFVDLALAQIAALGTTVGFLFGIMPETLGALLFSMGFTFLGAAVFSVTRFRHERVPQEAVIGLTYAIACAVAILVVEKTHGAEHLKDILVGNLLWVKWDDVAIAAGVYALIGVIHVAFGKRFLLISDDPDAAYRAGLSVRAWDFLFYMTFGAVITFSTRVAGVLLVFVFLVAPAILAMLFTNVLRRQLLIGWVTGTAVTIVGLFLSWRLDLPSGPAVISFYGVALALGAVAAYFLRADNRVRAGRTILGGSFATVVVVLGVVGFGRWIGARAISVSDEAREVAANLSRDQADATARKTREVHTRQAAIAARVGRCVGQNKISRYLEMIGPEERLAHARARIREHRRRGLEFLLVALADEQLPLLYREEGLAVLAQAEEDTFGYDPRGKPDQNVAALAAICDRIRSLRRLGNAVNARGAGDE
jgi:zinc/manganese transport system permease protein